MHVKLQTDEQQNECEIKSVLNIKDLVGQSSQQAELNTQLQVSSEFLKTLLMGDYIYLRVKTHLLATKNPEE